MIMTPNSAICSSCLCMPSSIQQELPELSALLGRETNRVEISIDAAMSRVQMLVESLDELGVRLAPRLCEADARNLLEARVGELSQTFLRGNVVVLDGGHGDLEGEQNQRDDETGAVLALGAVDDGGDTAGLDVCPKSLVGETSAMIGSIPFSP